MEIKKAAMAGTLESSDIMVTVLPSPDGIQIDLTSSVEQYYGDGNTGAPGCEGCQGDRSGQGCSGLHLKGQSGVRRLPFQRRV